MKTNILIVIFSVFFHASCEKSIIFPGDFEPGIALTFDDFWLNINPLMEKYQAKATFFLTDPLSISQETAEQLRYFQSIGGEVGSHTMHHYDIEDYVDQFGMNAYIQREVIPSIRLLDSMGLDVSSFAYPYGSIGKNSKRALLKYFRKIRGVAGDVENSEETLVEKLGNFYIQGSFIDQVKKMRLSTIVEALKKAKRKRAVLVLVGHLGYPDPKADWNTSIELVDSIMQYAHENGYKFYRVKDL